LKKKQKTMWVQDWIQSTGCQLNGGSSECDLEKLLVFMRAKLLEMSGIHHQQKIKLC